MDAKSAAHRHRLSLIVDDAHLGDAQGLAVEIDARIETGIRRPEFRHFEGAATRVVIVFTDAPYHETMVIPEAAGGTCEDLVNVIYSNKIVLSIFAPEMECYDRLARIDKSEYEAIPLDGGLSPQEALATA